jgi:DNA-binding transcriptional LysR family regulator
VLLPEIAMVWVARPKGAPGRRRTSLADIIPRLASFEWSEEVADLHERIAFTMVGPVAYPKVGPALVAKQLVLADDAVSLLPRPLVAEEIAAGLLVELDVDGGGHYCWRPQLIFRARETNSAAVSALVEAARPSVAAQQRCRPSDK